MQWVLLGVGAAAVVLLVSKLRSKPQSTITTQYHGLYPSAGGTEYISVHKAGALAASTQPIQITTSPDIGPHMGG